MSGRWFEEFQDGEVIRSPGKTITEAEMVAWALTYDPQPFHMDAHGAAEAGFGGLIGSGWQLAATAFRLFLASDPFADGASLGSPGCDELRWRSPVRPGDTVYVHATVAGKRPSASKPDRGLVNLEWRILNQRDETLMTMRSVQIVRKRPPAG